ncbi:MAG: phosphatidic acid phosphatase [Nocardioidaceae bacterium]|nr:phosphatidic acid phosphatase [Nocardioidaceae bacterium]
MRETFIHLRRPRVRDIAVPAAITAAVSGGVVLLATYAHSDESLDARIASDVVDLRNASLTRGAHLLTFAGSEAVIGLLALLLIISLLQRRGPLYAGLAALAMAVSAVLTVGVKLVVARDRPGGTVRLGVVDHSYSFPSGHTLNSAVFLGLVVLLLLPLVASRAVRVVATLVALALAAGIGWSRVYLGYHWATDVITSWLIAVAILTIVHAVTHLDVSTGAPKVAHCCGGQDRTRSVST